MNYILKSRLPLLLLRIATILMILLTFVMFNEWWNIKVRGLGYQYPWGDINDNPWYYANEDVYSQQVLITGIVMLLPLGFSLYFQGRRENRKGLYAIIICIISPFATDYIIPVLQ